MKVTLIRPNIGRLEHSLFVDEARMEPLQLGVLAGMLPPQVHVELYDDRVEEIPYDSGTDLVAITVETFTARRAYEIAAAYRSRDVPVVMGGMHATLLPDEVARHADAVYTGDAAPLWSQVIADAQQGKLQPRYNAPVGPPQPGIQTRRDLFQGKGYLPITLLQFSRGCRYSCEFCATSAFFGQHHFCRRVDEVVLEIQSQRRRHLFFVDDNILANRQAAKQLFRALIPLGVKWVSQATIDVTHDRELMDLMVKSGCLGNVIGFESLDPRNLRSMHKTQNLRSSFERYEPQIEILRDYGLQTWAAFTIGHDRDTPESIAQLLDFAIKHKFTFAAFNVLMPYPGTRLYARLAKEDRLLYDGQWWLHPEYRFNHAAFRPALMSARELTQAGFHCRSTFNSIGTIVKRAFDTKTNLRSPYRLAIYMLYNPLFRQETLKKHGMRLGTM